ncbi:MAG: rod shape-determining protein MreD [candidate division KSB1 bacterium]|nr:rod shape-determining protein MreD [candidate division KSB1 bacterium]MDZ7368510.1 rod shape-determining protein MreD [candidate division KSB1 bacterium]MDZ7406262.1 rod shape-determining protein MreD [candidate division KSB1 bacterium]
MIRLVKYALMFIFLILLQTTLIPLLSIQDIYPDLLLIGVVITGIRHGATPAILAGCLAGFVQDAAVTQLYGLSSLAKSVAGFVAGYFSREKLKYNFPITLSVVAATALTNTVLYQSIYYFSSNISMGWIILRYIIPHFIYTVIIGMMVNAIWPGGLWGKT